AHPAFWRALARAHACLGRLLREALVGEDVDPDLAATLDLARHRDTSGLDLPVRDPAGIEGLEPVVAELDGRLAARVAGAPPAMHLAELRLLRHQHQASPSCFSGSAFGLRVRFGFSSAGFSAAGSTGVAVSGAAVAGGVSTTWSGVGVSAWGVSAWGVSTWGVSTCGSSVRGCSGCLSR